VGGKRNPRGSAGKKGGSVILADRCEREKGKESTDAEKTSDIAKRVEKRSHARRESAALRRWDASWTNREDGPRGPKKWQRLY